MVYDYFHEFEIRENPHNLARDSHHRTCVVPFHDPRFRSDRFSDDECDRYYWYYGADHGFNKLSGPAYAGPCVCDKSHEGFFFLSRPIARSYARRSFWDR
jgi:hypothetical protein